MFSSTACFQDCLVKTTSPRGAATDCYNPQGRRKDPSIQMFSSASECCKSRLAYVKLDTCETTSKTGASSSGVASPGLGEWRKNNAWSFCVLGECPIR
jgi:hypothetical protein